MRVVGGGGMGEAVGLGDGEARGGKGVSPPPQAKRKSAVNTREIAARIARAGDALGFLKATEPTPNEPAEIVRRTLAPSDEDRPMRAEQMDYSTGLHEGQDGRVAYSSNFDRTRSTCVSTTSSHHLKRRVLVGADLKREGCRPRSR